MLTNKGNSWTDEERIKLLTSFDSGSSIRQLVQSHQRTGNAIITELVRHNRLIIVDRAYKKVAVDSYVTFDELKELNA